MFGLAKITAKDSAGAATASAHCIPAHPDSQHTLLPLWQEDQCLPVK